MPSLIGKNVGENNIKPIFLSYLSTVGGVYELYSLFISSGLNVKWEAISMCVCVREIERVEEHTCASHDFSFVVSNIHVTWTVGNCKAK